MRRRHVRLVRWSCRIDVHGLVCRGVLLSPRIDVADGAALSRGSVQSGGSSDVHTVRARPVRRVDCAVRVQLQRTV